MSKKDRADNLLFQAGLTESREQAKKLIMAAQAFVKIGKSFIRIEKPGQQLPIESCFEISTKERFVSRGGYKLLTAIEHFSLDIHGAVALDAGASTGGFTDCLLQHGVKRVYAVDVGHNQLHERLLNNPNVINMEGVNLRFVPQNLITEEINIVVSDVSFISLTLVLSPCMQWLSKGGTVAALIKPQFEVGPAGTIKGIVRDENMRNAAIEKVLMFCANELNLDLVGVVPSTIKGAKGNQEYMAVWKKNW